MKEIKAFKNAITQASRETSLYMTHHVRSEAKASGWPSHVANSVHVSYGEGGFKTNIHGKHKNEALDLEYGTPSQRPTAALRRAGNRTGEMEEFLVKRLGKIVGK